MKDWNALEADVVKLLNKHYTKGRQGHDVDFVVVHYNAGNLTIEGCWSVWQTRSASAHYQVEDDGTIGQLVWDSNTAWHAGDWNANCRSIGVEHANEPDGTITEECLDNGAHLVAAICKHFGLGRPQWGKNVYPHKHFSATSCPGQIYGKQKSEYIKRAQQWYDAMTGSGDVPSGGSSKPSKPSSGGSSKPKWQTAYGNPEWFGPKMAKELQRQLGTTADGVISGQPTSNKKFFWAVSGGVEYGSRGSDAVLALQKMLKAAGYDPSGLDRYYGKGCIKAHQRWLKAKGYYTGEIDGYHGHETNKAMCKALAAGAYK